MESRASTRHVRVGPQKARLVVDLIRGKSVEEAIGVLEFNPRRVSKVVAKTLKSAIANAESTHNVDVDALYVKAAWVDGAQTQKRFLPRAHGRATRVIKRSSHVTIVVDERKKA
ncbi:MAG: 50S ribosomal protein L22 [Deltaproteobacteria bacterium]|nr:50S ribosomal protein L22 [Deltaproteobacteria bacterium]